MIYDNIDKIRPVITNDLIRIGSKGDGGYIINKCVLEYTKVLLSFGINDNWEFEEDFYNSNNSIIKEVICFDYSVSKTIFKKKLFHNFLKDFSLFSLLKVIIYIKDKVFKKYRKNRDWHVSEFLHSLKTYLSFISFFKENKKIYCLGISNHSTSPFITFAESLNYISKKNLSKNSIFLKIDIEGSEYYIIDDIIKNNEYINSIVIEFHQLAVVWGEFICLIEKLKCYYFITHVHGNNNTSYIDGTQIPMTLEITFIKKELLQKYQIQNSEIQFPINSIDYPCNPNFNDIFFNT